MMLDGNDWIERENRQTLVLPGTEEQARATVIHLPEKPGVQTFDLLLPESQKGRVIEGTVLWPDGQPARKPSRVWKIHAGLGG
jgi:hypothetical protein